MAGEMLVDGVVQDFGNAVMQCPLVGTTDVHPGLLANGLETFQFAELRRVVGFWDGRVLVFVVGVCGI
jgi:hypothetical protein